VEVKRRRRRTRAAELRGIQNNKSTDAIFKNEILFGTLAIDGAN
jgi:hypothetical protein